MYQNEKNVQVGKCPECNTGYIVRTYREKRLGMGGFPLSIKVIHKCNCCGHVGFKHDYTDEAKIDFQEYMDESSESVAKFYKFKRMRKDGQISDLQWQQLVDAGAVW